MLYWNQYLYLNWKYNVNLIHIFPKSNTNFSIAILFFLNLWLLFCSLYAADMFQSSVLSTVTLQKVVKIEKKNRSSHTVPGFSYQMMPFGS